MVHNAEQTAQNAAADFHNDPGMCLQQSRIWAGIDSCYPDATTAWKHTNDRHPGDRNPPRGSAVYWTGGSQGYGHIGISLGGGNVRSTDAAGAGNVGTRHLDWFTTNWGLPYAGWAWDINEVTIPHGGKDEDDMPLTDDDLSAIAKRVNQTLGDFNAQGEQRDPKNKDPEQANQRLNELEVLLRRVEDKIDRLL